MLSPGGYNIPKHSFLVNKTIVTVKCFFHGDIKQQNIYSQQNVLNCLYGATVQILFLFCCFALVIAVEIRKCVSLSCILCSNVRTCNLMLKKAYVVHQKLYYNNVTSLAWMVLFCCLIVSVDIVKKFEGCEYNFNTGTHWY